MFVQTAYDLIPEDDTMRGTLTPPTGPMILGARVVEDPTLSIDHLALSTRARNCLYRSKIKTAGQLASHSATELLGIKQFGLNCLDEVRKAIRPATLRRHNIWKHGTMYGYKEQRCRCVECRGANAVTAKRAYQRRVERAFDSV